MASLLAWMACNLDKDLCIGNLAERSGMSERSFSRHFVAATDETFKKAPELKVNHGELSALGL